MLETTIPSFGRRSLAALRSQAGIARLFVVLVCAAIIGLTGWRILDARDVQRRESQVTTNNLARSLADHARATIDIADALLAGVVERVETDGTGPAAVARLHVVLASKVEGASRVRDLMVFDARGKVVVTSLPVDPSGSAADREYFEWHLTHADRGPHLGPPVRGRHNGRWTLTVSRRLETAEGQFNGAVVATLDCEIFARFYSSFDIGPHGSAALASEDSTLLVRIPEAPGRIGQKSEQAFRDYRRSGPIGNAVVVSVLDGVLRYTSFRKVDDAPLVVFVSLSEEDVLRRWEVESLGAFTMAILIATALALLGWRLADQIGQRQHAEVELRRSEGLYRLLAETSTDLIIQSTADGRRTYVSPASRALLGYAPDELMGRDAREIVHPDDWPAVSTHLTALTSGAGALTINYRARHQNGTYVWVEEIGRQTDDGAGSVVAIRDISARKRVEELLHAANNRLQRMAMMDGMTGIANRRCFDITLEKEMRRCTRAARPLAALLIDVDHFKTYNDSYGHIAGDACLRLVAKALEGQARRPGDLLARYGGEEFVVLLPDTDRGGAVHCAEELRLAVRGLSIPHAASNDKIVTVSIGVAVVWPTPIGPTAEMLIDAADVALYQAKRNGRDRIHFCHDLPQAALEPSPA